MLKSTSKFLFVAAVLSAGALEIHAQQPATMPVDCSKLAGMTFDGNATVTSATVVTSGSLAVSPTITATDLPPFCRVQGMSKPSSDSAIFFEVWLPRPDQWNLKFLSAGEGGYAGTVAYGRSGTDGGLDGNLKRGYATASTDTGHKSDDTWWAIGHPEKQIDYLYRAKHLSTVAAKAIVAAYYGRPASYSYFNACSNGGRQGLVEAQRYPEDFDGLIIGAPWNFQSHSNAGFVWNAQALNAPGAAIPAAKLPAITAAVMAQCDAKDGLVDGILADPRACKFDASVLACTEVDTDKCLTPPQLEALKKIYDGPKNPRTGQQIFPGFAVGSETSLTGMMSNLNATGLPNGYFANLAFENPQWDFKRFDFDADMKTADDKIGSKGNAMSINYSAARARGAKIIQYHGWTDPTLQPAFSPEYYDQVAAANGGLEATQNFYRLFMVPGMNHCSGGIGATTFGAGGPQTPPSRDPAHDILSALENWVEKGVAPEQLIATKYVDDRQTTREIKYTRPLCVYPSVPQYKGSGDPNDAASFVCRK